jgi:hypothetical protein
MQISEELASDHYHKFIKSIIFILYISDPIPFSSLFSSLFLHTKMSRIIWFKYGNTQATSLKFQRDIVDNLKKDIKKELDLSVSPNHIFLKKHNIY